MKVGALHAGVMLTKMQRARRVSGHHTRLEQGLALLDVSRWKNDRPAHRSPPRPALRAHRDCHWLRHAHILQAVYQGYAALVGMVRHIAAIDAKVFMTIPSWHRRCPAVTTLLATCGVSSISIGKMTLSG